MKISDEMRKQERLVRPLDAEYSYIGGVYKVCSDQHANFILVFRVSYIRANRQCWKVIH